MHLQRRTLNHVGSVYDDHSQQASTLPSTMANMNCHDRIKIMAITSQMIELILSANLQVIVTVESLAANVTGELRRPHKNLSRCGNPILTF
jgi:uncharacterized membrane protein YqhA